MLQYSYRSMRRFFLFFLLGVFSGFRGEDDGGDGSVACWVLRWCLWGWQGGLWMLRWVFVVLSSGVALVFCGVVGVVGTGVGVGIGVGVGVGVGVGACGCWWW